MSKLVPFLLAHQFAIYCVYMSIVSTLPTPIEGERWYKMIYDLLHLASMNVGKVFPAVRIQRAQQG